MSQALLDRVLEPFVECLTREAAQKIVNLRADPHDQARVDELADKANEGQLSDEERAEYDRYLAAFHFITRLQAQARGRLERKAAS
jgi:hypothetical protein